VLKCRTRPLFGLICVSVALCATNTVSGLIGIDLDTLDPLPSVAGYSAYGGYSGPGIKPIALRCVAQISKATGLPVSGLSGLFTRQDAVEFMAVGASTVQLGTAVMWHSFGIIDQLTEGLNRYLDSKGFANLNPVIGAALPKVIEFPELSLDQRARAQVNETCNGCLLCVTACADGGYQAISGQKGQVVTIDAERCDGCGLCMLVCPQHSIEMVISRRTPAPSC